VFSSDKIVVWRSVAILLAVASLLAVVSGCGRSSGLDIERVRGKVTLDGNPLPDASVEFMPVSGRPSAARTDADGNYVLEHGYRQPGALRGQHTVLIKTGGERPDPVTGEMKVFPELVPAKYNTKSELQREIQAGNNEINFELQSR
jgi:hypothetical protein